MHHDAREIIIEILAIIDFQEDRESFADRLIDLFHRQATIDVIESLEGEDKNNLKQKLTDHITPEMEKTLLLQYITPDKYLSALKKSTERLFRQYLEDIYPTLSQGQIEKLKRYLKSLPLLQQ